MRALLLAVLLAGCGPTGAFPSLLPRPGETPRLIAAPGAEATPALSAEERQALRADLAREEQALAAAEREIAAAGSALDRALRTARGAAPGDAAWADAQLALSRFDMARSPLAEIDARLVPALRVTDGLDGADPDRTRLEVLRRRTSAADAAAASRAEQAGRTLGG
jgi:hypothetical protein